MHQVGNKKKTTISLSTPSTVLPSDISPEELTSSRLLKKVSPVPKIPRKYPIEKIAIVFFFLPLKKLIISKKSERSKEEISQEQRNRKRKQPQYFRSTRSNAEKDVNKHR